MRELGDLRL